MAKFLKGQDVKLKVKGKEDTDFSTFLEKETTCSLSFNVNTIDASNKSDDNPEYDHAEYDNTELSAQVSGNVNDAAEIKKLLKAALTTGAAYAINAVLGTSNPTPASSTIVLGTNYMDAVITSLEIDMPAEGLATVSASIECGSDFSIMTGSK